MAIAKSHAFEVSRPMASVMSIFSFLMSPSAKTKNEDNSVKEIADGFNQMVNGLSKVLKGTEIKLNEMIDVVLDTGESILSDTDIESIQQLESFISVLRSIIFDDAGLPAELKRSIAHVIERGEILISLELQLRPYKGEVIHVEFDSQKLNQEANDGRDINALGWDEDE